MSVVESLPDGASRLHEKAEIVGRPSGSEWSCQAPACVLIGVGNRRGKHVAGTQQVWIRRDKAAGSDRKRCRQAASPRAAPPEAAAARLPCYCAANGRVIETVVGDQSRVTRRK